METYELATLLFILGSLLLLGAVFLYLKMSREEEEEEEVRMLPIQGEFVREDDERMHPKPLSPAKSIRSMRMKRDIYLEDDEEENLEGLSAEGRAVAEATKHTRSSERARWREFQEAYCTAKAAIYGDRLAKLEREEVQARDQLSSMRDWKCEHWTRSTTRWKDWAKRSGHERASLGLKLTELCPRINRPPAPEGAAGRAKVTRADGGDLADDERRLKEGDLLIKVVVPASRAGFERGGKPNFFNDDSWPLFHRQHMMFAIGDLGDVSAGTEVALYVVRDKGLIEEWDAAMKSFLDAGGQVADKMALYNDPPLVGGPTAFPAIPADKLLRADIVMQRSSHRFMKASISQLRALPEGKGIDLDMVARLQGNPEDVRGHIRDIFEKHDINRNGTLELSEMQEVHKSLAESFGLPPLPRAEVEAQFHEADSSGDGRLDFGEFYFYLYDQLRESLYRLDDMARSTTMQDSMIASTRMDVSQSGVLPQSGMLGSGMGASARAS
eukprot:TRINITY_DN717_c3_g1_i1.p1 TRINITY_DN717_c3_g1~~TRINITY_DN717_c3_g1_i1.p1  ORF type:complete len:498 (+),score=236.31 TRINITY_DN717_c3_g1_i1:406-1899(+)